MRLDNRSRLRRALRRERASGHQAGSGEHASLAGADLVEQNLAARLGSLEHVRLPLDAHHISMAVLALAVGDIAAAQAVELGAAEQIAAMLLLEFFKFGERREQARDQA